MRLSTFALLFPLLACASLFAETAPAGSALAALKLLPRGEAKRLARIEARDGTPAPERWYFIVHDPKSETGVHEYVVASGAVVASRDVSQFAENLRSLDVIGSDALKFNSDRVAKLAQDYALANNMTVSAMHYELKKEGAAAAPLWNVTCIDDAGKELGHLVVTAAKGTVVSHEGFAAEPPPPVPTPKPETPRPVVTPRPEEKMRVPVAVAVAPRGTPVVVRPLFPDPAPPDATPPPKKPGLFNRLGNSLHKAFTGKDPGQPAQ